MRAADKCPGLLRPHAAADGAVVRLRLPGGQTTADVLTALSGVARSHGNPDLQLTSRAGLQLRGLPDPLPGELVETVLGLGLIPSIRHERVRNIVASPLTGVAGGRADLRGLIHDLDRALVDDPGLADLPGRFLFVLDDGRGDVLGRPFDLGYQALDSRNGLVLVGSAAAGFPVRVGDAVDALIDLARDFERARRASGAWHVRELPEWISDIDGLGPATQQAPRTDSDHVRPDPEHARPALGDVAGAASLGVPLGMLAPDQVAAVTRVAAGPVVVTPWRGLVIPGGAAGLPRLVAAGLVADAESPWSLITACVGAPHCVRAAGSTRMLARELVDAGHLDRRVHISGCERRCGAPSTVGLDLLVGAAGARR